MSLKIRTELPHEQRPVEELTREAFWNQYQLGCDEHLLVHQMRSSPDFIPELNFVALKDEQIIGNIMYTKSFIEDELGNEHATITFGPLSVLPKYQKQGVGRSLIEHSIKIAQNHCRTGIVIYGYPHYYCMHGFKSSRKFQITNTDGRYPFALLVYEMSPGSLSEVRGKFHQSQLFEAIGDVSEFDKQFPHKDKLITNAQVEFEIACKAYLD